ncbi:hypothetical protein [uncultured Marivirga sp.]|uniref:hypothetical protein n=1 Tax=uncultured Marivirga sp. TaxID=1123707 RepID=UPI0030EE9328
MKTNYINFGKHLLFGTLIILGGLFLYLITVRLIGYLPYSHVPGPGWYPHQYALNWEEILFFLKFIFFLGIYLVPTLAVIFILFKFLMRLWYNRLAYTFFGTMAIAFCTAYWTWRTGGYLAFDLYTTIAGEIMGIVYGAMLFPFYIKPIKKEELTH